MAADGLDESIPDGGKAGILGMTGGAERGIFITNGLWQSMQSEPAGQLDVIDRGLVASSQIPSDCE